MDAGIILAIVLGSSLLSFYQEYRASTAVQALKKRLALTARMLRDGTEQSLPVTQIVPGDVLLLCRLPAIISVTLSAGARGMSKRACGGSTPSRTRAA